MLLLISGFLFVYLSFLLFVGCKALSNSVTVYYYYYCYKISVNIFHISNSEIIFKLI